MINYQTGENSMIVLHKVKVLVSDQL